LLDKTAREFLMGNDNIYEVHIEYDKNASSAEAFKKASAFLETIDEINNAIAQSISADIVTNAIIEKIGDGSFKVWLVDKIKKIQDVKLREYAKDPRVLLGDLLVAGKKIILEALSSKSSLSNQEKAVTVIKEIENEIKNSELEKCGYKINKERVLKAMDSIGRASIALAAPPIITIDSEVYELDAPYVYSSSDLPEIEHNIHSIHSVFKIKKPDLVGDSMWTIYYNTTIDVKILDSEWLEKLHNREISISSGDSLDAILRVETYFNNDTFEISEVHYFIEKIFDIVPLKPKKQLPLIEI
jgi:hypothetical protein